MVASVTRTARPLSVRRPRHTRWLGRLEWIHSSMGKMAVMGAKEMAPTRPAEHVVKCPWFSRAGRAQPTLAFTSLPSPACLPAPLPTGDDLEEGHQACHKGDECHESGAPDEAQGQARQPAGPAGPVLQLLLHQA